MRRAKDYLKRLVSLDERPEKIALAFAIGVFLGFSPLLGLHTLLSLSIAFLFGLNRVAILMGTFVNNPWTLVPIYSLAAYVGGLLFGFPPAGSLPEMGWSQLFDAGVWMDVLRQWRLLTPLLFGSLILSVFFAALSYPLVLLALRQRRSPQPDSAAPGQP